MESLESRLLLSSTAEPVVGETNAAAVVGAIVLVPPPPEASELKDLSQPQPRQTLSAAISSESSSFVLAATTNRTNSWNSLTSESTATGRRQASVAAPMFTVFYKTSPDSEATIESSTLISIPWSPNPPDDSDSAGAGYTPEFSNTPEGELTPEGIRGLQRMPFVRQVLIEGTLQPEQTWLTCRLPVGPHTQSVDITVTASDPSQRMALPALDEVYLVSRSGQILAQLKGAAANMHGPRQDVTISLSSVPAGAQLLLRVVETPSPSISSETADDSASGDTSEFDPSAVGLVPFQMNVQRTEQSSATTAANGSANSGNSADSSIGYVNFGGTGSGSVAMTRSSSTPTDTNSSRPVVSNFAITDQMQIRDDTTVDDSEDIAPMTPVGPMVLIGSAPLGPRLGDANESSTVTVDRHERAFDLSLESSSDGIDPELLPSILAARRRRASEPGDSEGGAGSVEQGIQVALVGPGGFPVVGSEVGQGDTKLDPKAVLATLAPGENATTDQDNPPAIAAEQLADTYGLQVPVKRQRVLRPNLLTAACGLILGIGLASGPLYPDLIAFLRTNRKRNDREEA